MSAPGVFTWALPVTVGQDLALQLAWAIDGTPVDLTGYTAVWRFGKKLDTPALITVDEDPELVVTADTITLTLTGEDTEAFTRDVKYHLLVLTNPAGIERRLLEGPVERFGELISE